MILRRPGVRDNVWFHLRQQAQRSTTRHTNPVDGTHTFSEGLWDGAMWKAWQQKRKGARDANPDACWFTREGILELFLLLFVDAFQPYHHVKYSVNAMILAIGNLSAQVVHKKQNLILVALIPGTCQSVLCILASAPAEAVFFLCPIQYIHYRPSE